MEDILNLEGVEPVIFQRGEVLIEQDAPLIYVYYLQSGKCYRESISEGGQSVFHGYKSAFGSMYDALVGVLSAFSREGLSESHFVATERICAYRIPKQYVLDYYAQHHDLMCELLAELLDVNRQNMRTFNARTEGRVPNHLCKMLYYNAFVDQDERLRVKPEFSSFVRLSQKLGVHKVTVSKMMRALRHEEVLYTEGRKIYIRDKEKLLAYAMNEHQLFY